MKRLCNTPAHSGSLVAIIMKPPTTHPSTALLAAALRFSATLCATVENIGWFRHERFGLICWVVDCECCNSPIALLFAPAFEAGKCEVS